MVGALHPIVSGSYCRYALQEYAIETTFGHNRYIEMGLWNNESGDIGILMDPSPSVRTSASFLLWTL